MPCVPGSLLRSVVAAVVLCTPACASAAQPLEPPAPQSLPDGRTPGPVPLSGIPAGVTLTDVQWLAADELFAAGYAGDLFDHPGQIAIWRSHDGGSWRQAFLGEELFWWENGSPRIALARTMDGFVAVGTSCRKGCRPIVLASDDGWSWHHRSVPVRPPATRPSGDVMRLVASTIDVPSSGAGIDDVIWRGRDLVAVGWSQVGDHTAHATSWQSTDGGRSWVQAPADPALGGRVVHMERIFRMGDRLVAGGFEQGGSGGIGGAVWESTDGARWQRRVAPSVLWQSSWAVSGGTLYASGPDVQMGGTVIWASEDLSTWRVLRPGGLLGGSDFHLLVLEFAPDGSGRTVWELNDGTGWARLLDAPAGISGFLPVWTGGGWLLYENSGEQGQSPGAWFAASAAPDDPPLDGP